jgi:hypothetical protein
MQRSCERKSNRILTIMEEIVVRSVITETVTGPLLYQIASMMDMLACQNKQTIYVMMNTAEFVFFNKFYAPTYLLFHKDLFPRQD